ncbi:MAG TPA: TraR/DksA C4-type zinc finger protein [Gaiellaceae bacterium]|nr:TraR/DksA C4-type zinc finger protein [Gaiellaceae bacterium]
MSGAGGAPDATPSSAAPEEGSQPLAGVRQRLEALRAELLAALVRERAILAQPEDLVDRSGQHLADGGTDLFLREWSLVTLRSFERELSAVEDVIDRLDQGGYGTCAECGRPIEPERLVVRPQAIRRAECEHRYRTTAPMSLTAGRPRRPRGVGAER